MTALPIPYTELATSSRQDLLGILPLPMPMSMHIEPTNICNFRCVSCPQTLPDYKEKAGYYQHMDFGLFEKILGDIKAMGRLKALKLFGYGESMVNPDLGRMIRLAKEMDVADRIELTSNCTRLTETMAQALIDGPLDYLRCSIYSNDQAAHEKFTQTKVRIETVFENLKRLRQMRDAQGASRPYIYVKMFETISPEDEQHFRDKFKDIGDELTLEMLHNMTGIDDIEDKLGVDVPEHVPKRICPAPFYMSSVAANGDVTICCVDWSWSSKVGNLKEQSLREIWYGPALNEIRRKLMNGERKAIKSCANCTWDWSHPDNIDHMSEGKAAEVLAYYAGETVGA
jgi:radical SAM protein with 4Fe4S-binding SPASM domain